MVTSPDSKHLISNLVSAGAVVLSLRAGTRDDLLAELVAAVPPLAGRTEDQQLLLRALLEREQLHSTGIGDGIALPHTRNTVGGLVPQPLIVLGRHPNGLAFGAIDGKPVRVFFLLVTTSVTQHLQILARISRVLRDSRLREALLSADSAERMLQAIRLAESA